MARVLIVDDAPDVRDVIAKMLVSCGQEVVAVGSGFEAFKELAQASFDLIITDILMPDMTGIRLIDNVRDRYPKVKILAISGGSSEYSPETCTALARERGADAAMMKPVLRDKLITLVNELLPGI